MLISVAIPCYRSEKNLEAVVTEIKDVFKSHPEDQYQIVLVCDGSPDYTDEVIKKLCDEDKQITGVLLSRNFTQSNAKMAALPYVKGDVLVYMDDDGQHPAEDIFKLVDKINEGYDVVYAHFTEKQQSFFKIWTSDVVGWLSEKFGRKPKGIKISSFMAYSRFSIDMLMKYESPSPSPGAYLYCLTTKITNIESVQRKRKSGKSGYNLARLIALTVKGLTNFTIVPLRIMDGLGMCIALTGIVYGLFLILRKLIFNIGARGYTSLMVVMLILGGLILIGLGVVGEYVGRVYMLLSNKPQFVVRTVFNDVEKVDIGNSKKSREENGNETKIGNIL